MRRISKPSVKDDYERAQKRKASFKRNKNKRRTPKQLIPKVKYGSEEYYEANKQCLFLGPYYDPLEQHIHKWKNGTIPCSEDPKNKFFVSENLRKEYHGSYCTICHKTRFLFNMGVSTGGNVLNKRTSNLIDAMKEYISEDEDEDFDSKISNNGNKKPRVGDINGVFEFDNVDIRKYAVDQELFIPQTFCKFIDNDKITKCGKIIEETKPEKFERYLNIEDDDGVIHKVNTYFVFPQYNLYEKSEKLIPVKTPPKYVSLKKTITITKQRFGKHSIKLWFGDKQKEWEMKWNCYTTWRKFQQYLKKWLPNESEFYQSFTESEKYNSEEQAKLKKYHGYEEDKGNKFQRYNEWIRHNPTPIFLLPKERVSSTYYKVTEEVTEEVTEDNNYIDNEIQQNMKRLRIY